ncbi:MAG: thiamine diphosphokinase [Thermogemmatispora sp.]|uniref:thiamine diphosphokinase n=1 Tax=Thermogemmatispora sp. TaxID=1968838 RepID=UPI002607A274|nr:thiamine diphosphokinase [Thermogemmatispora sp.]MBX5456392.1 thiamine diphosphokinase [Thermogemmatispora sp.]
MQAVIFAGGTLRPSILVEEALRQADLILAADGGAESALRLGRQPEVVLGDLDSLAPALAAQLEAVGCRFVQTPVEKNETDSELALQYAIEQGATAVTILGALGGARCDHALANVLLLAAYDQVTVRLIDGPSICWLLRGPGATQIRGQIGDLVSLLPLAGDAQGVATQGLYYPLHGETLVFGRPRGVSNQLIQPEASISLVSGQLLIIHTCSDLL